MTQTFDAIVIGAGQAGPSLTSRLTASGMKVALIERDKFGGTCVNTGCMPTKTLVASAYVAHLARRGADYGIVLDQPVRIDMRKVRSRAATVTANSSKGVENWLRNMKGCTVFQGSARFEGPKEVRVGAELLSAPRIFLNVGGRAIVPDLPGLNDISYLTTAPFWRSSACRSTWWWLAAAMSGLSSPRCTGALARRWLSSKWGRG